MIDLNDPRTGFMLASKTDWVGSIPTGITFINILEIKTMMRKIKVTRESFFSPRRESCEDCETITVKEMLKIRDSVKFEPNTSSVLNKELTKQQAYELLFDSGTLQADDCIHYLQFRNIIREFILKRKKFSDEYKDIRCVYIE